MRTAGVSANVRSRSWLRQSGRPATHGRGAQMKPWSVIGPDMRTQVLVIWVRWVVFLLAFETSDLVRAVAAGKRGNGSPGRRTPVISLCLVAFCCAEAGTKALSNRTTSAKPLKPVLLRIGIVRDHRIVDRVGNLAFFFRRLARGEFNSAEWLGSGSFSSLLGDLRQQAYCCIDVFLRSVPGTDTHPERGPPLPDS